MPPKKKNDARGGAPKPGTKAAKAAAERSAETAKKAQASTEEPKKPSVKEVIGGASWTGKLPVNMLAEHCQKQKWEKPEYTMVWPMMAHFRLSKNLRINGLVMLTILSHRRLKSRRVLYPPLF